MPLLLDHVKPFVALSFKEIAPIGDHQSSESETP